MSYEFYGSLATTAALAFGIHQYRVAQRWKRAEFAAKHLARLREDSKLALGCIFLDWSLRDLPVPEEYQAVAPDGVSTFRHSVAGMLAAMRLEDEVDHFAWPGIIYRDVFDHLFAYLGETDSFIEMKLIDLGQVASLHYWIEEIQCPRFVARSRDEAIRSQSDVLTRFMERYEHRGACQLLQKFKEHKLLRSS